MVDLLGKKTTYRRLIASVLVTRMKIQSVQRAIDVLCLFSKSRPKVKLVEIARSLDLGNTTVHGIVSTLEQNGFLKKDPRTREYRLGAKIYELGAHFASSLEINLYAATPGPGACPSHQFNRPGGDMG